MLDVRIRGLKRKEIKALKKQGVNPLNISEEDDNEKVDASIEKILLTIYQQSEVDEMTPAESYEICTGILDATYSKLDTEIKN